MDRNRVSVVKDIECAIFAATAVEAVSFLKRNLGMPRPGLSTLRPDQTLRATSMVILVVK